LLSLSPLIMLLAGKRSPIGRVKGHGGQPLRRANACPSLSPVNLGLSPPTDPTPQLKFFLVKTHVFRFEHYPEHSLAWVLRKSKV
jgi:hypothetical protein